MPVISTNTAANSALRFLNTNSMEASSSVGKLASGSRIVRASDDAAGLAIGTRLNADSVVLQQAMSNAAQGASIVQVADGALARISDVLTRMKSLAAQSLSGTPTDTERGYINAEYGQLLTEISEIVSNTRFNGNSVLDGTSFGSVDFFVGTAAADVIAVNFADFDFVAADQSSDGTSVATAAGATAAMTAVDADLGLVAAARAQTGAYISRFETRGEVLAASQENIAAAASTIMDVDLAAEQSKLVSSQVLVQAAVSALSQANQIPQSLLRVLQ